MPTRDLFHTALLFGLLLAADPARADISRELMAADDLLGLDADPSRFPPPPSSRGPAPPGSHGRDFDRIFPSDGPAPPTERAPEIRSEELGLTGMLRLELEHRRSEILDRMSRARTREERGRLRGEFLEVSRELDRIDPPATMQPIDTSIGAQKRGGKACRSACAVTVFGDTVDRLNDYDWRFLTTAPVPPWHANWQVRGTGADDPWVEWYARFPSATGFSSAGIEGIFAGFWGRYMRELTSASVSALFDAPGFRTASDELTAGLLVRFPGLDPTIADAIATGALLRIAQALSSGGFVGGGSTGGFSDVSLQLPLLFEVFDFGAVDGDIISLQVTDQSGVALGPITFTMNGPASATPFAPDVTPGRIEIAITAQNTGDFFPNTGEVRILSAIISGDAGQQFSLDTNETGLLVIIAAPPAVAGSR